MSHPRDLTITGTTHSTDTDGGVPVAATGLNPTRNDAPTPGMSSTPEYPTLLYTHALAALCTPYPSLYRIHIHIHN